MKLVERTARRAQLPLKYSEGFNPHPRISYALARPAGVEGHDEIVEIMLTQPQRPDTVEDALNRQVPEGLRFHDACVVGAKAKARVTGINYTIDTAVTEVSLERAIAQVLARDTLKVTRHKGASRERTVDIRPFVRSIQWRQPVLEVALNVSVEGTAKLHEVLGLLGLKWPDDVRFVARTVEATSPRAAPARTANRRW